MRLPTLAAGLLLVGLSALPALPAPNGGQEVPVTDIHLTNDRTVDCTADEAILKAILRDGMTDQQKAIALWRFYIQRNMHKEMSRTTDNGNTAELMTKTGYGLCGNWGHHLAQLAATGGMKASSVYLNGHVVAAIHYWGAWHMLDADMDAIYPKADGVLASPDEIRHLKDADGKYVLRSGPPLKPFPWYLGPDSLKGVEGLYDKASVNQPYARRDYKWKYNLTLRPGQEISWSWYGDPDVGFVCLDHLPSEDCGKKLPYKSLREYLESDHDYYQRETGKPKWSWGNRRGGLRPNPLQSWNGTLGNGRVTFNLARDNGRYALSQPAANDNLAIRDGKLALVDPAKAGSFTLDFAIPYSYGDAWIMKPADGKTLTVELSADGKTWTKVYENGAAVAPAVDDGSRIRLFDLVRGRDGFQLRFTLAAGSEPLTPPTAIGAFVHTWTCLPGLALGKNRITLQGHGDAGEVAIGELQLAYVYDQIDDDKGLLNREVLFPRGPSSSIEVDCGAKHWPLMREIVLACNAEPIGFTQLPHTNTPPVGQKQAATGLTWFTRAIEPTDPRHELDWGALPWDWCYYGVNWWNDFERGDRQGWAGAISTGNTAHDSDFALDNNLKTADGHRQLKLIRFGAFLNRDTKFRCQLYVKNVKELKAMSRHQDNGQYYAKTFADLKDGEWQPLEFAFNDLTETKEGKTQLHNGDFLANLYLQVYPADGKTEADVEFRIDNTVCYDGDLKHDPFKDPDAAKHALQDDPVWNAKPPADK